MKKKLLKLGLGIALFPWTLFVLALKGLDVLMHVYGGCLGF